jgi:Domain of unknown function (DUF4249)
MLVVSHKLILAFKPSMENIGLIIIFFCLLLFDSCVTQFVPNINEDKTLLVVEGKITDQPRTNIIKLSKSAPLGPNNYSKPLKGCKVSISDYMGQIVNLKETKDGTYITDSTKFRGVPGRQYTLHITGETALGGLHYESSPVEMKPVPPIDSLYYEKKVYASGPQSVEGCQIYLDTHDPADNCKFFRWEFSETWEFHLPYAVPNRVCWITDNSDQIFIKNTAILDEARVSKYLINSITDPIDRLSVKYSILVNQYSLNEDEYHYWQSIQNISDQVGGLYDIIPFTIPSNVYCVENPDEKVLGYFSVSAMSSKRLFIKDNFAGYNNMYDRCLNNPIPTNRPDTLHGINTDSWIIIDNSTLVPPVVYITFEHGCADCRARGSNIKPSFWNDGK